MNHMRADKTREAALGTAGRTISPLIAEEGSGTSAASLRGLYARLHPPEPRRFPVKDWTRS